MGAGIEVVNGRHEGHGGMSEYARTSRVRVNTLMTPDRTAVQVHRSG